jgi:hypothetical protein
MIVAVQDIIARCQHSLSTFSYIGGPAISVLWKDALDGGTKHSKGEVQSDMLRAALNNEYWDIAQQVRFTMISLTSNPQIVSSIHPKRRGDYYKYPFTLSPCLVSFHSTRAYPSTLVHLVNQGCHFKPGHMSFHTII